MAAVNDVASLVELPVGPALPGIGSGSGKGLWQRQTWDDEPRPPSRFYIARATGAHQPYKLGAPDQGAIKGIWPDLWIGLGDQIQQYCVLNFFPSNTDPRNVCIQLC